MQNLCDTTKPQIVKVRAFFYVLQHGTKRGCIRILIHPHTFSGQFVGVFVSCQHPAFATEAEREIESDKADRKQKCPDASCKEYAGWHQSICEYQERIGSRYVLLYGHCPYKSTLMSKGLSKSLSSS